MHILLTLVTLLLGWLIFMNNIKLVAASNGDTSYIFNRCLNDCKLSYCSTIPDLEYHMKQPLPIRWIGWQCPDECKYDCMWKAVEAYARDGSGIPKFYGKWPFIKILGMQEIASVVFSFLNIVPHVMMLLVFRRNVPSSAPMYWVAHIYALVCIHAWIWSVIFHARDTPMTEKMDYFTAFSLICFNLFTFCVRIVGTEKLLRPFGCILLVGGLYAYHIHYLAYVHFDYGYNMEVNVAVALINTAGWLTWAFRCKHKQPYVKKLILMLFLFNGAAMLEILDFPPFWWIFDAHSLWHLSTAPLCFIWYSFLIDDCLYLEKSRKDSTKRAVITEMENQHKKYYDAKLRKDL